MPSLRRLLKHRVEISRAVEGPPDEWNQPVISWEVIATGVPALIQERTGRETPLSHEQGPVVITALTFFDMSADVTEQDRIFRPSTGRTYEVLYVKDAAGWGHHWQVDCRLIEPGGDMPGPVHDFQPSRTALLAEARSAARDLGLGIEEAAEAIRHQSADLVEQAEAARADARADAPTGAQDSPGTTETAVAVEAMPKYTNPWDPPEESW